MNEANDYESTMSTLLAESKEITDGGCLDKADMDGVEKTAMPYPRGGTRWTSTWRIGERGE